MTTLISGRELIEILGNKYNLSYNDDLSLSPEGVLKLNGNEYVLPIVNKTLVDVSVLIDLGVLSIEDFPTQ